MNCASLLLFAAAAPTSGAVFQTPVEDILRARTVPLASLLPDQSERMQQLLGEASVLARLPRDPNDPVSRARAEARLNEITQELPLLVRPYGQMQHPFLTPDDQWEALYPVWRYDPDFRVRFAHR